MLTRLYQQWYLSLYCSAYQLFKKFYETNSSGDPSKDTASIMTIEGRAYPVDIHYLQRLEMLYFGFPNTDHLFLPFHSLSPPSLPLSPSPTQASCQLSHGNNRNGAICPPGREARGRSCFPHRTGGSGENSSRVEVVHYAFPSLPPSLPPSLHLPERGGEREEGQRDPPKFGHIRDRVCVFNLCCQH